MTEKDKVKEERLFVPGLFSFGIVCYRNWEFMTQTIDSVLEQDYSTIQLIVSDDGSGNFPIEEFEAYIEKHKHDNVVSYIVRESERNEGTVRHLNHVLECAEGEYIMLMAGDDTLDNPRVLSKYVEIFKREGPDCGVVMAQTALYDRTMTQLLDYYVWPDVIEAINSREKEALVEKLHFAACVPTTSTCFHRWVIDKYTPFDTSYSLIEDYPFHLKLAEENVRMCYENIVSARHRDGGISHGAVTALSRSKQLYIKDCIRARKKVFKEAKERKESRFIISFNRYLILDHERMLFTTGTGIKGYLRYALRHPIDALVEQSRKPSSLDRWVIAMLVSLLALLFVPEVCGAVASVFPRIPVQALSGVSKIALTFIAAVSAVGTVYEAVKNWIRKIDAFPGQLL